MIKKYDKLIRDKIPEIIESRGAQCKYHIADTEEYRERLGQKLLEEVQEYLEEPSVEELADLQEIVNAICYVNNWNIVRACFEKVDRQGAFVKRYVLQEVVEKE